MCGIDINDFDSKVFELLSDASEKMFIYVANLTSDYSRWSKSAVDYFGLPSEYIENTAAVWSEYIHPDDRHIFLEDMGRIMEGTSNRHRCEYRARTAHGDYIWVRCEGVVERDENGNPNLFAGTLVNLGSSSKFDPLTGLLSPYEFVQRMQAILDNKQSGVLLLFGIDDFKRVNDAHGFAFGDVLMRDLYQSAVSLPGCMFFRMDGDKCACIMPDGNENHAEWVFSHMTHIAANLAPCDGIRRNITLSCGAVTFPEHGNSAEELRAEAEHALDQAKSERRGSIAFFSEELHQKTLQLFQLKQVIKNSIDADYDGFSLRFQPQIDAASGKLFGAEALLRFTNANIPAIGPVDFVPVLENEGMMHEVGTWILRNALRQAAAWRKVIPSFRMSINVSYMQISRADFRKTVLDELNASGLPPEAIILELTESSKITEPDQLKENFEFFAQQGIMTALDDFGTGYATIAMLRELQPPLIKIDHTSVAHITENALDQAIIEYILQLCKHAGIKVCVEGVENKRILRAVTPFEPDILQGYFFASPLSPAEFEARYIRSSKSA